MKPAHTLITFLGRSAKGQNGYRATCYDFGEGNRTEPLAFFGWALRRHLQPNRMVILGTRGSMWDHLFESDHDLGEQATQKRMDLMEAVNNHNVSQELLDEMEPLLAEITGCDVQLRLIPYGRTEAEQAALLEIMAKDIETGAEVDLDITHGFRHLPMLALLAALHLQKVKAATINNIWYGSFDPDTQQAPVMQLKGVLHLAQWLEALASYEDSGEYAPFAALIGGQIGKNLAQASFLESINRIGQARTCLRTVLRDLEKLPETSGDPALPLFLPELKRRIQWAEQDSYYQRQRDLAWEFLKKERFLQATLKGYEAFITRLLQENSPRLDPDNYHHRKQVQDEFRANRKHQQPLWEAYDELNRLRNAIAHGSQPKGEKVQKALSDPAEMKALLTRLFTQLIPEEP